MGVALGLVGPVSVYCDWVGYMQCYPYIPVWQHIKLVEVAPSLKWPPMPKSQFGLYAFFSPSNSVYCVREKQNCSLKCERFTCRNSELIPDSHFCSLFVSVCSNTQAWITCHPLSGGGRQELWGIHAACQPLHQVSTEAPTSITFGFQFDFLSHRGLEVSSTCFVPALW